MADRNSPPPEEQSHAQSGKTADSSVGAASSDTVAKEQSEDTKHSGLESNPTPVLAKERDAKTEKTTTPKA